MRYWVYKDAQILGPIEGADFIHRKDLSDALVCPEGAAGVQESDWRSAEEMFSASSRNAPVAQAEESSGPGRRTPPDEWGDYVRGAPTVTAGGEEASMGAMYHFAPTCEIQFKSARRQIAELQEKLGELTRKIEQYEERQNMLLERLSEKDQLLDEKKKFIEVLQVEMKQVRREPVPSSWTIEEGLKTRSLGSESSLLSPSAEPAAAEPAVSVPPEAIPAKPDENPISIEAAQPVEQMIVPAQEITYTVPPPEPQVQRAQPPVMKELSSAITLKDTSLEIPHSQDFNPPAPETLTGSSGVGWAQQSAEPLVPLTLNIPAKPAVPEVPPIQETRKAESQVPSTPFETAKESAKKPLEAPAAAAELASSWPPPSRIPTSAPIAAEIPASSPSRLPESNKPGSVDLSPVWKSPKPAPFEAVPDLSLKRPKASPVSVKKKRNALPVILGVTGIAAVGVLVFYFSSGSRKIASNPSENSEPPVPVQNNKQNQPATLGRDYIADLTPKAIEFVKNYPLNRGRQSISKWLQYSFLSVPGNEDEWTAGAQSADSYIVQYRVYRGGRSVDRAPIAYIFEADLAKNTVQGLNPPAKELLAGGGGKTPVKAGAAVHQRKNKHVKPQNKPHKPKKKAVPQLPLPGF